MAPFVASAHMSDFHAGSPYFVPNLMDRAVVELNELRPDVVAVTGDLTNEGFKQEYQVAKEYLDRLECPTCSSSPATTTRATSATCTSSNCSVRAAWCCTPARSRSSASTRPSPTSTTAPSAAPATRWLEEQFAAPARFRIFMLHHHLLPIPGTGRERNMVYDAGDTLEVLQRCNVNLVLSGHKHVPHAWRLREHVRGQRRHRAARCACAATPSPATTS